MEAPAGFEPASTALQAAASTTQPRRQVPHRAGADEAETTRLERATAGFGDRCSSQLSYVPSAGCPAFPEPLGWCPQRDSNSQHNGFEPSSSASWDTGACDTTCGGAGAESEGFEPPAGVTLRPFSKRVPSASQPALQCSPGARGSCGREGSNLHGAHAPPGPEPGAPTSYATTAWHSPRWVSKCGERGSNPYGALAPQRPQRCAPTSYATSAG